METINRFWQEDSGTQVVENGLVMALISIAEVATMALVGAQAAALYQRLVDAWPGG